MNHRITIGAPTVARLQSFRQTRSEGPLTAMLDAISRDPQNYYDTRTVLEAFRGVLKASKKLPQDEKEALCSDLEAVMDILRIESSDGLLNEWLHGISL